MIRLTAKDKKNLVISSKEDNPWEYLSTNHVTTKGKIKKYIKTRTQIRLKNKAFSCSYCLLSLSNNRNDAFDIDHILPISIKKFKNKAFSLKNLCISCTRCNRSIKSQDFSFYIGNSNKDSNKPSKYLIIHPFYDNINSHLRVRQINDSSLNYPIVIYKIIENSPKGHKTYEYFELENLVKDAILTNLGKKKITYDNVYEQLSML